MAHEYAEAAVREIFSNKFQNHRTRVSLPQSTEFDTDLMAEHAQTYANHCMVKAGGHYPPADINFEMTIPIYKNLCFGTADFVAFIPGDSQVKPKIVIIDYKYGKSRRVKAEGNVQMMLYAYGAMKLADATGETPVEEVYLAIVQPRSPTKEKISEVTYSAKKIRRWFKELVLPAIIESQKPNPEHRPDSSACRICNGRTVCRHAGGYSKHFSELCSAIDDLV